MITAKSITKYMYMSSSLIYLTHPDHRIRYSVASDITKATL